ncbi:cation:proton antiporter [Sciscionella marina]|uniref:cation:proton antiporter n=1 Tax=Sciscionella marina TaxID=508770 RepID=UPI00039DB202|nr:cation:proton antiporter [Sciscionella marina]
MLIAVLGAAGVLALLAAVLPRILKNRPLSMPLVMLVVGIILGLLPIMPHGADVDPRLHLDAVQRFAEFGLLLALASAGLKSDRVLSWRGWRSTMRLLAITLPLSIAMIAVLGWWAAGLAPAAALLLGAALSPTDPVLASDVQVPAPGASKDNEVRFTLTTEAGLNDACAMPFVLAAVALVETPAVDWGRFVLLDVVVRIGLGVLVGVICGGLLGWLMFRVSHDQVRLSEYSDGLAIVAIAALPYALAEFVHGLGFLAVFVAAVTVRYSERSHGYHQILHQFGEQLERLYVVIALAGLGVAIGDGLLTGVRLVEVLIAGFAVLVARPLLGWLALLGAPAKKPAAAAIAFFGVRGIGSIYYLSFALGMASFSGQDSLWRITALTVTASVVVHGVASGPIMQWLERRGIHRPA